MKGEKKREEGMVAAAEFLAGFHSAWHRPGDAQKKGKGGRGRALSAADVFLQLPLLDCCLPSRQKGKKKKKEGGVAAVGELIGSSPRALASRDPCGDPVRARTGKKKGGGGRRCGPGTEGCCA